jgi:hypothetical protein
MVYVDYTYYKNIFFGKLEENKFNELVIKASREIDKNVNIVITEQVVNQLKIEAQDRLKYTTCVLIDLINRKQESDNRKITGYSIDGVNKTFKDISVDEYNNLTRDVFSSLPHELTCYL